MTLHHSNTGLHNLNRSDRHHHYSSLLRSQNLRSATNQDLAEPQVFVHGDYRGMMDRKSQNCRDQQSRARPADRQGPADPDWTDTDRHHARAVHGSDESRPGEVRENHQGCRDQAGVAPRRVPAAPYRTTRSILRHSLVEPAFGLALGSSVPTMRPCRSVQSYLFVIDNSTGGLVPYGLVNVCTPPRFSLTTKLLRSELAFRSSVTCCQFFCDQSRYCRAAVDPVAVRTANLPGPNPTAMPRQQRR